MSQTVEPISGSDTRDLPTWLTVIVVLLCLSAGGGVVWWYFTSPPRVVAVPLADRPRQMPVRMGANNNGPPRIVQDWNNDVRSGTNNSFQVRAGDVQMWVRPTEGKSEPSLTFYYRNQLVPREQLNLLRAMVLANREDQAQRLKLTAEQVAALKKIRNVRGMRIGAEDEKQVMTAWNAYQSADASKKGDTKASLLTLLDAQGKKNLDATKTALNENVTAIRAVLSAEQQKMLESGQF